MVLTICILYTIKRIEFMSSDAQKNAYKRYNQKKKTFSAVYTPTDMIEAERFEKFLSTQTMSKNEYIKMLIKRDMDSKNVPYV
jgi:hypothetical protein